jgi:serine/threonine protein kinase/WD40 repeat protein
MNGPFSGKYELLDRLAEEFAERFRRGERPALQEYAERYPDLAEEIRDLFPAMVEIERAEAAEPPPGPLRQVADYRIVREIGRGGMGVVYEAEQASLGRRVALKVLRTHIQGDAKALARFKREARAAAQLHHTNIVPVFDVGQDGEHCYYAMQYIQGQGLDQIICELRRLRAVDGKQGVSAAEPKPEGDGAGPPNLAKSLLTGQFAARERTLATSEAEAPGPDTPPPSEVTAAASAKLPGETELSSIETDRRHYFESVARIGWQTASALAHAHERGIIHRDIKPSNLLLDAGSTVWITDFGLAKTEEDALTRTGDIVGTIRYMPPERFQGRCDPRADVYALGMTLYELLVLRPAFASGDRMALMSQISTDEPARPRTLDPRIPRDLETIVLKAIAKDPDQRYRTAQDLCQDLRCFLDGEPIKARRTSWPERVGLWSRRNPALAGLLGVLILAVAGLTVFGAALLSLLQQSEASRKQKEQAEREKTEQLYRSLVDQARASRFSRRMGQRYESLKVLGEAARIAQPLAKSEDSFLELRNLAIACMTLRDLRVTHEWPGWSETTITTAFDDRLERYARMDRGDRVSICSAPDSGAVICSRMGAYPIFGPDGRFLLLENAAPGWELWDLENSAAPVARLVRAGGATASFSPDSRHLALSGSDGSIALYELPSAKLVRQLGPGPRPCRLAFDPRAPRLAVIHQTGVALRDLETGNVTRQFSYPFEYYPLAAWHPDGKVLAAVGGDRIVRFWDVDSGKELGKVEGFKNAGITVVFDATGDLMATNGWEGRLRLWDWRMGQQLLSVPTTTTGLRFSKEGDRLACGVADQTMTLWQVSRDNEYRTLRAGPALGSESYTQAAISRDGRLLAAGAGHGFGLWDLTSGKPLRFISQRWTTSVRFEPSGSLLTFGEDGLVRWPIEADASTPDVIRLGLPRVLTKQGAPAAAGQSRDGTVTAFGLLHAGSAGVMQESEQGLSFQFLRHGDGGDVWGADISPDGRWVATGCHHSTGVRVWDARSGKQVRELLGGYTMCGVGFSPDNKWLATTGGGLRLWAVDSWEEGPKIGGGPFGFSLDGKLLAVETGQGVLRLLDPGSAHEYARLEDPNQDRASSIAFSPDGSLLAVASGDGQAIHIWDLRAIRTQLAALGLDWSMPSLPAPWSTAPLRISSESAAPAQERPGPDDLISRTVSWSATPKKLFADPGHVLTEVVDFRDLAGATSEEFHGWFDGLGTDFRLAQITRHTEAGHPLLNAVAVRETNPRPARFFPEMTFEEGADTWHRMLKANLRCVITCDWTNEGRFETSQLWLAASGSWGSWAVLSDAVADKINEEAARYRRRPVYLSAPCPGGLENFRINVAEDADRAWRISYALSRDELLRAVEACSRDRWRPDVLAPYMDGDHLRFMLVTVDNQDGVDWRFRMDMSLQDYRTESAEQKRQGLFPLSLVSYKPRDEGRYAAVWVRYRIVEPESPRN